MAISKLIHEIKTFSLGIISKPDDERDVPDNAAKTSLNIDNLSTGELRGIPKDLFLSSSGFEQRISPIGYIQGQAEQSSINITTAPNRSTN